MAAPAIPELSIVFWVPHENATTHQEFNSRARKGEQRINWDFQILKKFYQGRNVIELLVITAFIEGLVCAGAGSSLLLLPYPHSGHLQALSWLQVTVLEQKYHSWWKKKGVGCWSEEPLLGLITSKISPFSPPSELPKGDNSLSLLLFSSSFWVHSIFF